MNRTGIVGERHPSPGGAPAAGAKVALTGLGEHPNPVSQWTVTVRDATFSIVSRDGEPYQVSATLKTPPRDNDDHYDVGTSDTVVAAATLPPLAITLFSRPSR